MKGGADACSGMRLGLFMGFLQPGKVLVLVLGGCWAYAIMKEGAEGCTGMVLDSSGGLFQLGEMMFLPQDSAGLIPA